MVKLKLFILHLSEKYEPMIIFSKPRAWYGVYNDVQTKYSPWQQVFCSIVMEKKKQIINLYILVEWKQSLSEFLGGGHNMKAKELSAWKH